MNGLGGLVAFTLGWMVAQVGKPLVALVQKRGKMSGKELFHQLTKSGGMPSGHTASFVALTMFLGLKDGFDSSIFVLAVGMALIVIYDAVNVRMAVGEQGKKLNDLAVEQGHKGKKLRVVEGHTVPQVIVGGVLGVLVGWITFVLVG